MIDVLQQRLNYFLTGLGFRPMPPDANVESTLIWFKASDKNNYRHWTDELDKFLEGNETLYLGK